ncbi:lactadherin-like [Acanthaster planci]|uniref:Lactadherin-like n=1 Tax=Acanthaster planci TaxID=133434 RepID=A0A8B7ZFA0_ACAPL|nr:lactadherin-like [Acanthaster planci]
MVKMACLLVASVVVLVLSCANSECSHQHNTTSALEIALRPLYSQLETFKNQLHVVKALIPFHCRLGVRVCSEEGPLGMEDGRIPDGSITASSFFSNDANYAPPRARLNTQGFPAAWADAGQSDPNPWIQVDFNTFVYVTALITQGRGDPPYNVQRVTQYQVMFSDDGEAWSQESNEDGTPTKFPGNIVIDSEVTTRFSRAIHTRFLRILPTDWTSHCSMRFEVVGCY